MADNFFHTLRTTAWLQLRWLDIYPHTEATD